MDCTKVRNLLSEYQDGTLDGADEAALAVHLRGCGECAGCADALLAVRETLRSLPPEPAPPELLARVRAAVEAEERDARAGSAPGGAVATRPFLSRFRIPLEAVAAVLLFASVYWYQRTATLPLRPSSAPIAQAPAAQAPETTPPVDVSPEARENPKPARKEAPVAPKPRTWTAADLPSVPAIRASTNSERIVPIVPFPGPTADPAEGGADFRLARSFAPPPSRLLRPLPYGRDIVVDVKPESREGAEDRIAEAALRSGGIFERIERDSESARKGAAGMIRVILPEAAAAGFLDELRRIGNVPQEGMLSAVDIPAGPRPGTIAYAVRIRVR